MNGTPINVLLIEDNPADARLIQELLREAEDVVVRLTTADRLTTGLEMLQEQGADCVLLDLTLPDSSGFETFHTAHDEAPGVPFIILTHLDDAENALHIVQEGAQDYLVKGDVDSRLLVRSIRYAIERKKAEEKVARYAEELHVKNALLNDDLNMAREVQQALLPQSYPTISASAGDQHAVFDFCHRYRPSAAVGGDFFNIEAVGPHRAGVFICDVMGHGMRAALVTAIIRGLVEKQRPLADNPGKFLTEISRSLMAIFRQTDQMMFASAFYYLADADNGVVRAANAGHPSPIYVSRRHREIRPMFPEEVGHGPGLGLFGDAEYTTYEEHLEPEDFIVLYTDGLTEAEGENGEEYGQDRLMESIRNSLGLPSRAMLDKLCTDVDEFAVEGGVEDDICLVGMDVHELSPSG
ncbi:MAG: SpoIIE family protein phosphatase [Candidatus Pacebacteria bacterium]|nr:SpoIIE family protein phosphatase [Candidatus Paceibacterota bacterium]